MADSGITTFTSIASDPKAQKVQRFIEASDRALYYKRLQWTKYEDIYGNKLTDAITANTKSQVVDPILSTLSMDRSARVMAQIQTGKVRAIDTKNEAAERLINLANDKYVIPNANGQFDYLTKARIINQLSSMYGNAFAFVDWDVKPNGYVGPDWWLIPTRDLRHQVGAISVDDSDAIAVIYWMPLSWFESKRGLEGWQNIDHVIEKLKEQTGDKQARSSTELSSREMQNQNNASQPAKGMGYWKVVGYYERDEWIYAVPDVEYTVIRDSDNPQDNGELPVINKFSIPMLDDFFGMGDYERGAPMQMTANALWNLYMDAVKVSIFPPVLLNKDGIADKSSIKWGAAAKWLVKGAPSNAAQVMQLSPQGTETFSQVMEFVKTSLLNMFGTSDTNTTQHMDPGFGKTPQALQMQSARENARDNVDRFYMEQFLSKLNNRTVNLLSKKADKIQFSMFEGEIKQMALDYPEVKDMYDIKTGKLTLDKGTVGGIEYQYDIIAGSTYQTDQQQQQQNLQALFNQAVNGLQFDQQKGEFTSPFMQMMKQQGIEIDLAEMFKRLISNSGIQDWDKIIKDVNSNSEGVLNDHAQQLQQMIEALRQQTQTPPAPLPHEVMNYKDVPPQAQQAMLQQAQLAQNPSQPLQQAQGQPQIPGMPQPQGVPPQMASQTPPLSPQLMALMAMASGQGQGGPQR